MAPRFRTRVENECLGGTLILRPVMKIAYVVDVHDRFGAVPEAIGRDWRRWRRTSPRSWMHSQRRRSAATSRQHVSCAAGRPRTRQTRRIKPRHGDVNRPYADMTPRRAGARSRASHSRDRREGGGRSARGRPSSRGGIGSVATHWPRVLRGRSGACFTRRPHAPVAGGLRSGCCSQSDRPLGRVTDPRSPAPTPANGWDS